MELKEKRHHPRTGALLQERRSRPPLNRSPSDFYCRPSYLPRFHGPSLVLCVSRLTGYLRVSEPEGCLRLPSAPREKQETIRVPGRICRHASIFRGGQVRAMAVHGYCRMPLQTVMPPSNHHTPAWPVDSSRAETPPGILIRFAFDLATS